MYISYGHLQYICMYEFERTAAYSVEFAITQVGFEFLISLLPARTSCLREAVGQKSYMRVV